MEIKTIISSIILASTFSVTAAFAAPHWAHDEQEEWGAIEDTEQLVVPHTYPYATCGIGKHQSPVDLATQSQKQRLNKLKVKYGADFPVFYNSGHGVQVNTSFEYEGRIKIGQMAYPLIQFHFHEPSEHVVNGQTFPAELHFVHVRDDGKLAVLGVLIEIGEESETFQAILDNMPHEEGERNEGTGLEINPASLLPHNKHKNRYFSLAGSLTTPPCSEGVEWYVFEEPISISNDQLERLISFYSDNARHPQDLNGRVVSTSK